MQKRFLPLEQIVPVYAVIAFVIYGWTIALATWKMPSWLFSLTLGEILSVLAYSFVLDFLESLFVVTFLLGLGFVLPGKLLREDFIVRGAAFAFIALTSIILHLLAYADTDLREAFALSLPLWWAVTLVVAAVFVWLASRHLRSLVLEIADRLIVFLYIFLPLSFLSLFVVIVRNLT